MPRVAPLTLIAALVLGLAVAACGRTELDPPFADASAAAAGTGGGTGIGGAGGRGGVGGVGGIPGAAGVGGGSDTAPIQCGAEECAPVTQACCIAATGGAQHCTAAGAACAGASFSCVDGTACAVNQICCFSFGTAASTCAAPSACQGTTGVVLCTSNLDCPNSARHCCTLGGSSGVCSPQPCP